MTNKQKNNTPTKQQAQKKKKQSQNNHQQLIATAAQFSGPLPPPTILQQYDETVPGAAERIIAMAEGESEHQKYMEKTAMHLKSRENRLGQYFAMATVILAFSTSIACAYMGATTAAAIIGGATVVGLVAVFITGREKSDKENP